MKRYFFAQDNSCHWYLVEAAERVHWDAWLELSEDDERAWDHPPFATRLDSGIEQATFEKVEL